MTVYDLSNKELKQEFRNFGHTTFGKVVFCLSYIIPFISMIVSIELFVISNLYNCFGYCKPVLVIALVSMFVSFVLGSRYFYKEFRKYFDATHKE